MNGEVCKALGALLVEAKQDKEEEEEKVVQKWEIVLIEVHLDGKWG